MKEKSVGFALQMVQTEQFAIIESAFIENEMIQLNAGIQFGIDEAFKIVACGFRFEFLVKNNAFLIVHVRCDFAVEDQAWSEFLNDSKTELRIPKGFLCHLSVLTIGTARGVLHAKTENTKYNQFFIPTVNANELVLNDMDFPLENA
jgi:hypothetical protein